MRGSLEGGRRERTYPGSIPAHAGEPARRLTASARYRVYPRACGGATGAGIVQYGAGGLSPRMRGSPGSSGTLGNRLGSIPAHAGEPSRICSRQDSPRVYPRACGGAILSLCAHHLLPGLSPRMRGSPLDGTDDFVQVRSIPAHAGEPRRALLTGIPSGVYPRACGGANCLVFEYPLLPGLSPRMRGSRPTTSSAAPRPGSIPAHAGEPFRAVGSKEVGKVYPRACGGAATSTLLFRGHVGLSPRMRGSLFRPAHSPLY